LCREESSKLGAPRPASRGFDLELDTRDRHQKILEVLWRLRAHEIAIGDNHDSVLAVPRHDLRPVVESPFDDLAEASLGILKLPGIHQMRPMIRVPSSQR